MIIPSSRTCHASNNSPQVPSAETCFFSAPKSRSATSHTCMVANDAHLLSKIARQRSGPHNSGSALWPSALHEVSCARHQVAETSSADLGSIDHLRACDCERASRSVAGHPSARVLSAVPTELGADSASAAHVGISKCWAGPPPLVARLDGCHRARTCSSIIRSPSPIVVSRCAQALLRATHPRIHPPMLSARAETAARRPDGRLPREGQCTGIPPVTAIVSPTT